MLPLRTAARTSVHRRAAGSVSTQLRATLATPIAEPSRTAREYIARHQRSSVVSRSLHTTSVWAKDNKRWVNSALKEGEEEPKDDKEGKEVKEDETKKEVEEAVEEVKDAEKRGDEAKAKSTTAAPSDASSKEASSGSSGSSSGPSSPGPKGKEIAKPSIPESYPQVLALPITRRPLFPGFYKAVTITSPPVIKAIRELIAHGQPYIGAFLLKDSDSDSDVITDLDQVHPVGVFAQITSVFSSADQKHQQPAEGEEAEPRPETLTAVLYPHRRIRIDELVSPMTEQPPAPEPAATPETSTEAAAEEKITEKEQPAHTAAETLEPSRSEDDVASFEKEIPSVEETREALADAQETKENKEAKEGETETVEADKPQGSQIGFLHPLLPEISLTNVSNLGLQPFKKDSQVVRAIMGEILAVFKEIAQLQPIFREQSESWPAKAANCQSRHSPCLTRLRTSSTSLTSLPTLPPLCRPATPRTSRLCSSRSRSRTVCRRPC